MKRGKRDGDTSLGDGNKGSSRVTRGTYTHTSPQPHFLHTKGRHRLQIRIGDKDREINTGGDRDRDTHKNVSSTPLFAYQGEAYAPN